MVVNKCAYALNVEADFMEKVDIEPSVVDMRFRCKQCQRVILVDLRRRDRTLGNSSGSLESPNFSPEHCHGPVSDFFILIVLTSILSGSSLLKSGIFRIFMGIFDLSFPFFRRWCYSPILTNRHLPVPIKSIEIDPLTKKILILQKAAEQKLTKTLMCKGCRQELKLKDINPHRHECFRNYDVVFSIKGNWKIKHIASRTNLFGQWIDFNTLNGNWKMHVSQYRGIAPPPEKGKREIEDSHEDSPHSESSDDPDKIDDKTMRMKKFDTGPWQCSGEKSGDSDEPEELLKVRSLRLKVSQFYRVNKKN
ncbi:hypothetical protein L1887_28811 [Cichorium endivia]|nr:hypothetical protein L1887_28811 [Cichorium endivia]